MWLKAYLSRHDVDIVFQLSQGRLDHWFTPALWVGTGSILLNADLEVGGMPFNTWSQGLDGMDQVIKHHHPERR
jgi:hypothetical protein